MKRNKRIRIVYAGWLALQLTFHATAQTQTTDSLLIKNAHQSVWPDKSVLEKSKPCFSTTSSKFILPTVLMVYGLSARFNELPIRRFDFSVDRKMRQQFNRKYHLDDYLQITTPILAYSLGFVPGIEARHRFRDRTLIMATSLLITEAIVIPMKRTITVLRPEGSNTQSFPSGHTAAAMTGAHLMYKEYKDVSPWIGVSGYLMATTTGILRMVNHAHWLSDVVMGVGIGLLSVEISYLMLPVWHSIFGITDNTRQITAFPTIHSRGAGIGIAYCF